MNKLKIVSIAFLSLTSVFVSQAQDIDQIKKTIDGEQYEKAKSMLKAYIQAKPEDGRAPFLLGNVYLKQDIADSANIYFQQGIGFKKDSDFNYIGLGQLELEKGNLSAAQAHFATATKNMRRKDTDNFVYIAQAYMNAPTPDFKNALAVLERAKLANSGDALVQMALGDAHYGDKNQNEAYVAYRNAFQSDNSLIRAKMQLGVLLKGAKAYTEAVKAYDDVIATNPNYGPVYRELAETYYYWGNNVPARYTEYIQKALGYYEKYMTLTDYSLTSRMRHADFLILAKDYAALEVEANKMKELDQVNPRILRYLGYSAYENGNNEVALKSLKEYISNSSNKVIARDYLYLGLTKIKKAGGVEGATLDKAIFETGVNDIKKAIEMDITMTSDLSEIGKKLYEQKLYKEAAAIYEIAVTNVDSPNYLLDNFYLGNSIYFDNTGEGVKPDVNALKKADIAFGNVITASPTTQGAYVYRARTNKLIGDDTMMAKYYEDYMRVVTEKGPEEIAKNKGQFVEAYNNIAAHYANFDKAKAKEYFNKTLAMDPVNPYATQSLKALK